MANGDDTTELLPRVSPPRDLAPGALHQTIIINTIEELHLYMGDSGATIMRGVTMTIDNSMNAKNVGIQSKGDVFADNATITITEAPTNIDQGFEKLLVPLVDAMKSATLSNNQSLMMNNYINMLRNEASKPKEKRDGG